MERLGLVDQIMHKVGAAGMPALHMQGAMVIDPAKSDYPVNAMILAEHIAARLAGFDILRKKLVQDPLRIGAIRLVEDSNFDAWDHISFATLPSPGDKRCLERHLGIFSAREFNYNRPLWQFEIIEGLAGGKIAIAQKLSHATMDGTAAMRIMTAIFDQLPSPPTKLAASQPSSVTAVPEPSMFDLLSDAVLENVQRLGVDAPKVLSAVSKNIAAIAADTLNEWLDDDFAADNSDAAPQTAGTSCYATSLNRAISADKRVVAVGIYETDKLKAISKAFGCKLNDVCLLMASEALISYFEGIGEALRGDYVFVMPMSTRGEQDSAHGNALALAPISSHSAIASLPERLAAIASDTTAAKAQTGPRQASDKVSVLDNVDNIGEVIPPLLIDVAATILAKLNPWDKFKFPANGVMSNVAGPRDTLFFAGMPIEYQIPMVPVFHNAALSIGATSMGNHFSFGFHACGNVVKQHNLHYLLEGLERAYQALLAAVPSTEASPPVAKRRPKRKAAAAKKRPGTAKKAASKRTSTKPAPQQQAAPKSPASAAAKPKRAVAKQVPAKRARTTKLKS